MTAFDWQLVRCGPCTLDLRNLIVLSPDPAVRQEIERDILRDYKDTLATEGGVSVPDADLLRSYRLSVLSLQIPCIGNGGIDDSPQRVAHAAWLVERVPRAITELNALDLIPN